MHFQVNETINAIQSYVVRHRRPRNPRFDARYQDVVALSRSDMSLYDKFALAIEYGLARGYQQAVADLAKCQEGT